jgi:4-hydroxy-3-methylbut-2-enyl diphosphate reductase
VGTKIEKTSEIGFCLGVRRAIDILRRVARERGEVETLGPVVHNQQVLQRLAKIGVKTANCVADIKGNTVVISSHGVSPQIAGEIRSRNIDIINATCPFVYRAQTVARRLAEAGFFVTIYGDRNHSEVKGILGWAEGKGVATQNIKFLSGRKQIPRRIGILSQTTQIPAHFIDFVKQIIDATFTKDSELRIIDTICHNTRNRQQAAIELAKRVNLMLVIGSHTSANTNRLAQLCSTVTKTNLIETADEIRPDWLLGSSLIGISAGASTPEETIAGVVEKLENLSSLGSESKPQQGIQ